MTPREMQIAFERELDTPNNLDIKPTSSTTFYWLNLAVLKFVKTRYSGTNYKNSAFEQNQKRIDDLRTLVTLVKLDTEINSDLLNNTYSVDVPMDYLFHVGTKVGILPRLDITNPHVQCWKKDLSGNAIMRYTDPLEATHDTVDRMLENSLSEHNIHYCSAKPIKLMRGNKLVFYTDDYYTVSEVVLLYIKTPNAITLELPFVNYDSLPEHTHQEVVKLAVQMYLESIANNRYTSYSNEVNTME